MEVRFILPIFPVPVKKRCNSLFGGNGRETRNSGEYYIIDFPRRSSLLCSFKNES